MTMTRVSVVRVVSILVLGWSVSGCQVFSNSQPATREPTSIEQFDRWMDELSNWGRWGDDDELGAAN